METDTTTYTDPRAQRLKEIQQRIEHNQANIGELKKFKELALEAGVTENFIEGPLHDNGYKNLEEYYIDKELKENRMNPYFKAGLLGALVAVATMGILLYLAESEEQ